VILLVSHDPSRLPATIRSRCQGIHVRLPEESVAVQWLVETTACDEELARDALEACAGSPLIAQTLLESGDIDRFRDLGRMLEHVRADEAAVTAVLESCANMDQEGLWSWISLLVAQRLRASFGLSVRGSAGSQDATYYGARPGFLRRVAELQLLADRNRQAQNTQLRKDLLLRDWLIQWSRLADT
jgi:DNA polymerase-3 subunit delta'